MRPEDKLIIAGEGELRPPMEDFIAQAGLAGSIVLTGKMVQEDLAGLMRVCDLFALTSSFEGMPMCVLEGLGSGLPAVSTRVTGVDRVLREGYSGLIVESREPRDLARAMARVLDRRQDYSQANCLAAVERYQARRVLEPIYEAHYELAAGHD